MSNLAILIQSETVQTDGKNLIVATIAEGKAKAYKDNKGIIWVKNVSDKRKVFSNAELRVMMQSFGNISVENGKVIISASLAKVKPSIFVLYFCIEPQKI